MNIPNFSDAPIAYTEDGKPIYLSPEWKNLLQQLFSELQINVSQEGFILPIQTTANIAIIENGLNRDTTGTIIYDSDTNEFKGNVNGTFKVFLS